MEVSRIVTSAPRSITVGGEGGAYERADELVAIHGSTADVPSAVIRFESDQVTVRRLDDSRDVTGGERVGPVYRRVPGGGIAVPTGRVLVRFEEGDRAEEHRSDLDRAGFALQDVIGYAPHAAWVQPNSENVTEALSNLEGLRRLPGVVEVEPQMLSERASRD